MIDKYDESLEVRSTFEMIKYTLVFNKLKRSENGTGSSVSKKLLNIQCSVSLYTTRK